MTGLLGYGFTRTIVEALFAGRGLVLAGVLGPEVFGIWTLFRLILRYLAFAGMGVLRGLELEATRAGIGASHERLPASAWGGAASAHTFLIYGTASLLLALAWAVPGLREEPAGAAALGGAMGLLADRLWAYGITYQRAVGTLRSFAILELLHAGTQFALCVLFAIRWGLTGAFAGFALSNLVGVALLAKRSPLYAAFNMRRVRHLIRIGFPVSLDGILGALLATTDRLLVGAFLGLGGLGVYAFAVAVSQAGVSLATIVRTVILRDVYGRDPAAKSPGVAHRALAGFATLSPALAGILAIVLPPLVERLAPDYRDSTSAVQLLLFAGVVQGLVNLAVLEIVAGARQARLPALSIAALCLSILLSSTALYLGFGLTGVAAAALFTRLVHGGAAFSLLHQGSEGRHTAHTLMLLIPTAGCAMVVWLLGRFGPATDLGGVLLQILLYVLVLGLLSPFALWMRRRWTRGDVPSDREPPRDLS